MYDNVTIRNPVPGVYKIPMSQRGVSQQRRHGVFIPRFAALIFAALLFLLGFSVGILVILIAFKGV